MMTRAHLERVWKPMIAASLMVALAACASRPPPAAQFGAAQNAITEAERSGAAERAPVELNNARNKLERAQDAARTEDYEQAERLAREAQVDAQLASSKAQSAAATAALDQIQQGITTLRDEVTRQQPAR